jgi:FKBP-type peptidyl-prolyl cis-trans isomerase
VEKGDLVTVQYTGALWTEGTIFDSSWDRGTPAQFTTDQVVPGFAAALEGAQVGSQVVVVVPPAQGYRDQATGSIPANSTLVFVIDILGID